MASWWSTTTAEEAEGGCSRERLTTVVESMPLDPGVSLSWTVSKQKDITHRHLPGGQDPQKRPNRRTTILTLRGDDDDELLIIQSHIYSIIT